MGLESKLNRYGNRVTRLGLGVGGLVLVVGIAVVAAVFLARPGVSLSSSGNALVQVHLSGLGTEMTGLSATSQGQPVVLVRQGDDLFPAGRLTQGRTVQVTVTARPPSWLHGLLGSGGSTVETVRTPVAPAPAPMATVLSDSGLAAVRFASPVSDVQYRFAGGASHVIHLSQPATVADLPAPSKVAAGSLQVTAAPMVWESLPSQTHTVAWFVAAAGQGPVALADPAPGTASTVSNGPLALTFDETVAEALGSVRPTLSPAVAGTWSEPAPDRLVFTPAGFGFGPGTAVTVRFDRPVSVVGAGTSSAAAASVYHFTVAPGSLLRLEQILAQLHFLPLDFTPATGVSTPTTFAGELATMSQPLAGTFTWHWASTPATLRTQWAAGSPGVLVNGALMSFESAHGIYDGIQLDDQSGAQTAGAATWRALLQAAAVNQTDTTPYSYVFVTKALPETLTVWQNGSVLLTSLANTGIPQAPTADGTYPIYERFTQNTMSGTNPDGSTYHDLVYWINYFNGGDAVHAFVRGSYGFPQSLGCVELPGSAAAVVYSDLKIGDLVTVAG
jgi:lipoprotein-anchoring transpeptidase ErfK/SrfK